MKTRCRRNTIPILLLLLFLSAVGHVAMVGAAAAEEVVRLEDLLREMVDHDTLARMPQPAYTQQQGSSYNRASKAKGQPGWFADSDGTGFLRTEVIGERTEWVLMDHSGPGCLTRMWTPFFRFRHRPDRGE